MRGIFAVMVSMFILAASQPVWAQHPRFPVKPVRLVSGFPADGQNDIVARTVGVKLAEQWGQSVVVDNRPGASGILAAAAVAKAEPDGYTLLLYSSGFAINAALQPQLPYDPVKDFTGVARIGPIAQALIVAPSLDVKTVPDLIALAKAQPGKIVLGSSGAGTGSHLIGEMVRLEAGIKIVHVGFKGNTDMLIQIAGGRVHFGFSAIGAAMSLIKDGKLTALAVTTPRRAPALPEVPTIAESMPSFRYQGGFGMLAPAKTPRAVLDIINAEIGRALNQPDTRDRLVAAGIVPTASSTEEFDRHFRDEVARYSRLIREIGLRVP